MVGELDRESGIGAGGNGETVIESAKSAVRGVSSAARDVARDRAQGLFESNKAAACAGIHSVANALRQASDDMDEGGFAQAARRAADKVEDFSRTLEQRDLGAVIEAAEDYARRQPLVFIGGALAAGFALARFLKASSERRHEGVGSEASAHRGESYRAVTTGGYVSPHTP